MLDGRTAFFERLAKIVQHKGVAQRLHAQAAQQFLRLRAVFIGRKHHRAKAARVVQAQHALRGVERKVVVLARRARFGVKSNAARHAQVQQQQAALQVKQQVFAPAAHAQHTLARERDQLTTQRPAQGFAHFCGLNARAGNAVGKTAAGHFNFG